jgi:hypothetical protein
MFTCNICFKKFNKMNSLGAHITFFHKELTKEQYYCEHINEISSICECGNKKKFRDLGEGYRKYCSLKCYNKYKEPTTYWKGKKQPKEMIEKRIQNTNQELKFEKQRKAYLERYNVENPSQLNWVKEKISKAGLGKKHPRSKEHQQKIIESKRKNGTLKHSQETKNKIRKSVNKIYNSDNPPVTISNMNNIKHLQGRYENFYYRSSYELKFIQYCLTNEIKIESAENNEFRLPYEYEGKIHYYYPDFYLPEYDYVVEIKPNSMLTNDKILSKIDAGMKHHRMLILDEECLENLDEFFEEIENEYLLY